MQIGMKNYESSFYQEAIDNFKKSLTIKEKVLGDFDKAHEYMSKAVEISQKILPANHPNLLTSQKSLKIIEALRNKKNL